MCSQSKQKFLQTCDILCAEAVIAYNWGDYQKCLECFSKVEYLSQGHPIEEEISFAIGCVHYYGMKDYISYLSSILKIIYSVKTKYCI